MPDTLAQDATWRIDTDRLMTEAEARRVDAAIKLAGLTRRGFCRREGFGYSTLCKTLSHIRTPTGPAKRAMEKLLRETRWPQNSSSSNNNSNGSDA